MTSTSDEAFRRHIASFNDMATAEEWKRRYEAYDSLVKALEAAVNDIREGALDPDDFPWMQEAVAALSQAKGGK